MMDYINKLALRELVMVMAGVGAIGTAALVTGLIIPSFKAYQATQVEHQALATQTAAEEDFGGALTAQHQRIAILGKQLDGDMASLPAKEVEAFIVGRLQNVSWSNSVELVSVEPRLGDRVKNFQEILFVVELTGQYYDLYRWLQQIRGELGFVVIKDYALRRDDTVDLQPQLNARLSLASYRVITQ